MCGRLDTVRVGARCFVCSSLRQYMSGCIHNTKLHSILNIWQCQAVVRKLTLRITFGGSHFNYDLLFWHSCDFPSLTLYIRYILHLLYVANMTTIASGNIFCITNIFLVFLYCSTIYVYMNKITPNLNTCLWCVYLFAVKFLYLIPSRTQLKVKHSIWICRTRHYMLFQWLLTIVPVTSGTRLTIPGQSSPARCLFNITARNWSLGSDLTCFTDVYS